MINLILFIVAVFLAYKLYENITKIGCKCENCGKNIKCDDQFCIYCGTKRMGENSAQTIDNSFKSIEDKTEKTHYNYYDVLDDLDGVIVALLAKISKSDGVVSSEEAVYLADKYKELAQLTNKTSDIVIDIYEEIFNREKDKIDNLDEFIDKLKSLEDEPKKYVLNILEEFSKIDGNDEVLSQIKSKLNL